MVRNLAKKMMKAFLDTINGKVQRKVNRVRAELKPIIFNAIYFSPEMESCRDGTLKYDFGLDFDPTFQISTAVADSVSANFKPFRYAGSRIIGAATINIQPQDNFNVLSIPEAVVITEKGDSLPWLDWLVNYGNSVIIADFGVKYSSGKGRSGGAIMTSGARPFMVDPSFAGTMEDNFISRALNNNKSLIEKKIWQNILN